MDRPGKNLHFLLRIGQAVATSLDQAHAFLVAGEEFFQRQLRIFHVGDDLFEALKQVLKFLGTGTGSGIRGKQAGNHGRAILPWTNPGVQSIRASEPARIVLACQSEPGHDSIFPAMRSSPRIHRRSSPRFVDSPASQPVRPASVLTTFLLLLILAVGPLMLGGARLWIELPILVAVAFLFLIQGFRLSSPPEIGGIRQLDAIDLSVLIFSLYAIARWLTSPTEYFSRIEIMEVVAYAGVFLTCRYGMVPRKLALGLIFLLVALGVFETAFGYYLHNNPDFFLFGPTEQLQIYYAPRWLGTYGCPNHYGGLLVMAVGAALALGCFSKFSWPTRIVFFYLAGMMMIGVMFSVSRGSWLALLASITALTTFGVRNGTVNRWVPITGALLIIVSSIALFSLSSVVRERIAEAQGAIVTGTVNKYVRYQLAQDALHIAYDHPVFGTGPGTFVFIHPRYQSSTFTRKAVLAHDDYLNCLDDYGIIGFGIAMFFVGAVTLKFFQPLRAEHRWQDRVVIAAAFGAWAALLVHSWVDFNLHIPGNALLFFALIGLGLGRLTRDETGQHWSTFSLAPLGRYPGWAVIVLSLGFGFLAAKSAISDIIYEEASDQALEVPTDQSIAEAERALWYDPANAKALMFLADLYRYNASRREQMEDRVVDGQKALDIYKKAVQANTIDDTLQARMGMTFDVMKRYPEAFFCYKAAVTQQPYNGQFWFWLGNHYWDRGMEDKAELSYLRARQCPHGMEGSEDAIKELRALPGMQDIPEPGPSANPLEQTASSMANPFDTSDPTSEPDPNMPDSTAGIEVPAKMPPAENHAPTMP